MTDKISLFIITRNESGKIGRCIECARGLVDEIVVVDGQSTDNTVEEARAAGAVVYLHPFRSFSEQKNFALSKVTNPWALNLDADEYLSAEVITEIRSALKNTDYNGFILRFVIWFLGKPMKYSGLNGEQKLRLVRVGTARYVGGLVHEKLEVQGKIGILNSLIEHHSYYNINAYFSKLNNYTSLGASQLHKDGKKASLVNAFAHIPFDFLKRYVLKLGFLDGLRGLIWASFSAYYGFTKYLKLWQLNNGHSEKTGSTKL